MGNQPRTLTGTRSRQPARVMARSGALFEAIEPRQLLSVTFGAPTILNVDRAEAIVAADFNRDGFEDLAVGHSDRSAVSVLYGDASGRFVNRTSLLTFGTPLEIIARDFQYDGLIDIAVISDGGVPGTPEFRLEVFQSIDQANRFQRQFAPVALPTGGATTDFFGADSEDVQPDRDFDIFTLFNDALGVQVNDGDGNFLQDADDGGEDDQSIMDDFAEADVLFEFDPDSDPTLALNIAGRDVISFFQTKGDDTRIAIIGEHLTDPDRGVFMTLREIINVIQPGDGGDGDGEDGFFQEYELGGFVELPWSPQAMAIGDVNRDGWFDFAVVSETENALAILTDDGLGLFTAQFVSLGDRTGGNDVKMVDFDGDGDSDIVVATSDALLVYTNFGGGVFGEPDEFDLPNELDRLAIIDANRDGRLEVAGVSDADDSLFLVTVEIDENDIVRTTTPGAGVGSALRPGNTAQATAANSEGDPLVFYGSLRSGFFVTNAADESATGAVLTDPVSFVDPKDGLGYAAAATADGLLLYRDDGAIDARNLSAETGVSANFTQVVPVVGTDRLVRLVALADTGELFLFEQPGSAFPNGFLWEARNLSLNDLVLSETGTPEFVGRLVGYTTSWNALHVAGLDGEGNIHAVWFANGLSEWRSDNISAITGADPFVGGLTAFLTSWGAINLAGVDESGEVAVTWWLPSFGGAWRNDSISALVEAPPSLVPSTVTSYVTPWSGLNIAGLDSDGSVLVFWWTPQTNAWVASNLSEEVEGGVTFAEGPLSAVSGSDATIYIFGTDDEGDVQTFAFGDNVWQAINLSQTATVR